MAVHVIFGAGQVGTGLARALRAAGHQVRVVRHSDKPVGEGIEVLVGDARDPAFALRAAEGATAIYHCMNPSSYSGAVWEAEFPALGDALISAATAVNARLVVLDNLYGYGIVDVRTESSPMAATGRKGRVRVEWDRRLRTAPGLRFAVGRAGDFFGPGTGDQSLLSAGVIAGMAKGSRPCLFGDADATHSFSYVPDVVAGLLALGTAPDDVEGRVFHLPVLQVAPRELVRRLGAAVGSEVQPRVVGRWALVVLGPVVPLLRELLETFYQWDRPFLVDDSAFRERFPGLATSLEGAVEGTVAAVLPPASAPATAAA